MEKKTIQIFGSQSQISEKSKNMRWISRYLISACRAAKIDGKQEKGISVK
jgi:hypothetical protein